MKAINYLNYFFVGLPVFFCLIAISNIRFLSYAMLSMIITGIFQLIFGIKMLRDEPQDKSLQIYVVSVFLFFLLLIVICKMELYDFLNYILFGIPTVIALFLSVIIYKKANQ
jgi:hypothetical protein